MAADAAAAVAPVFVVETGVVTGVVVVVPAAATAAVVMFGTVVLLLKVSAEFIEELKDNLEFGVRRGELISLEANVYDDVGCVNRADGTSSTVDTGSTDGANDADGVAGREMDEISTSSSLMSNVVVLERIPLLSRTPLPFLLDRSVCPSAFASM